MRESTLRALLISRSADLRTHRPELPAPRTSDETIQRPAERIERQDPPGDEPRVRL